MPTVQFNLQTVLQTNSAIESDLKEVMKKQLQSTSKHKDAEEKHKWGKL